MTKPSRLIPQTELDALAATAQEFVAQAMPRFQDRRADESFFICLVCDSFEGHTETCFIPAIEKWLKEDWKCR